MIRSATADDIDRIAELEILLFPDTCMNERSIRIELEHGLVFMHGTSGYIIARWGPELVDILRVGVAPEARRRGLGRELVQKVLEEAWMPVILTVKKGNTPARTLYRSLGFKLLGWMPQAEALILQFRK